MSESGGEAKRRKDYKKKRKKRAYVVTPQRIGITEHNPTQFFRKKSKNTDDGEGEGE
jgi:hypothetical protein